MTGYDDAPDLGAGEYPGLLADGSPGGIGTPEIWADAGRIELLLYGRLGGTLLNCTVTFRCSTAPVTYVVTSRRWSQFNGGRPYYVLKWPD